jgi:hypothetical protein
MDSATAGLVENGLEFIVHSTDGSDYEPFKGRVDQSAFNASGGSEPIRYRTTDEFKNDKCPDLKVLDENKYFEVLALWNGQELTRSDRISVSSRFKYINKYSEPVNQRFSRAIGFVGAKYNLPGDSPVYDSTLNDSGIVRTHSILPVPLLLFIQLGPSAFETENKLATTWIHETVHLQQGRSIIRKIVAGNTLYEQHVANGTDLSTISESDKDSIMDWINGERAAYIEEQNSIEITCISDSELLEITDALQEFNDIENALYD